MIRVHSPCVASNLPSQNPRLMFTCTCSSSLRFVSPGGLPIVNRPRGHQQNFIFRLFPSRSCPACVPEKVSVLSGESVDDNRSVRSTGGSMDRLIAGQGRTCDNVRAQVSVAFALLWTRISG